MKINLNNNEVSMAGESFSVRELLALMKFTFRMFSCKARTFFWPTCSLK
jgi:hypothetical protein